MSELLPPTPEGGDILVDAVKNAEQYMRRLDVYQKIGKSIVNPLMDYHAVEGELVFESNNETYSYFGNFGLEQISNYAFGFHISEKLLVLLRPTEDEFDRPNYLMIWESEKRLPGQMSTSRSFSIMSIYPNGGTEVVFDKASIKDSNWDDVISGETSVFIDDDEDSDDATIVRLPEGLLDIIELKELSAISPLNNTVSNESLRYLERTIRKLKNFSYEKKKNFAIITPVQIIRFVQRYLKYSR